ncbi:MAG: thioredoxin family protein [bacterium]
MRWFLVVLFYLGLTGVVHTSPERDPAEYFFDQSFGDFSEEVLNAQEQGKKGILIMFEMDDCPYCARMKATVLNQPEVQDYFKQHFLIFPVDIEGDVEMTDFNGNMVLMKDFAFKQYKVRATPVFQFFDLEGKPIRNGRFTGATKNAEEFLLLGRYIVEDAYEQGRFSGYKRAQKSN